MAGSESCPSLLVEPPEVCEKERSEACSSRTHRCIVVFGMAYYSAKVMDRMVGGETRLTFLLLRREMLRVRCARQEPVGSCVISEYNTCHFYADSLRPQLYQKPHQVRVRNNRLALRMPKAVRNPNRSSACSSGG